MKNPIWNGSELKERVFESEYKAALEFVKAKHPALSKQRGIARKIAKRAMNRPQGKLRVDNGRH